MVLNPGPTNIDLGQQKASTLYSPESPTPSSRGRTNIFRQYDLPESSPATNTHSLPNINLVMQDLQDIALHAHSKTINQVAG